MGSISLKKFTSITDEILLAEYDSCAESEPVNENLRKVFLIGLNDRSQFPNIKLTEETYQQYIKNWVKNYIKADQNPPSKKIATPKSTCSDPAIKLLVQKSTNVDAKTADTQERHHNLFMSAENIQGGLLEEYIDSKLRNLNWFWCKGNILRAIDFCTLDGKHLLQIKNKNNTENSSSSSIRTGTTIGKWYRLGTMTMQGKKLPKFKWDVLNKIVNDIIATDYQDVAHEPIVFSEADYKNFLSKVISENPNLLSDE